MHRQMHRLVGRSPLSPAVFVVLCGLAVHLTVLGNGFHYDDGHSILRNPHIRDLGNLAGFFTDPAMFSENPDYAMFRPIVLVSHAINYRLSGSLSGGELGGYDPSGYLAVNLVIHLINSLLVLAILSQLAVSQSIKVIASLIFCLHPLQTEVVNYASARSESLAALFYLGSICAYLRSRSGDRRPRLWLGVSVALFCLSLLTKEIAVTLPLALLAVEWYRAHVSSKPGGQLTVADCLAANWRPMAVLWAILCVYLVVHQSVMNTDVVLDPAFGAPQVRVWEGQLATQSKAIVHYLLGTILPIRLSVYPQFAESPAVLALAPLLSASIVVVICALAWRWRRSMPAIPLAVSWFIIPLIPTIIVPLHILVNDHRPYLSLVGFAFAFSALAAHFSSRRWLLWVLCGLMAVVAHQRDAAWRSEVSLWRDAALKGPHVPEAHFNLGHAYHESGDLPSARVSYERAVELSPDYARAQINLGAIYREEGRAEDAIEAFGRALSIDPKSVEAINNKGLTHASLGAHGTAIELYERALKLQPERAEVWLNLGLSLRDVGRREEAIAALRRAVQIDPEIKLRFPVR